MRLLAVISALLLIGCNDDRIAKLEKQNQELAAKLEATSKAASLDGQEKCANQALIAFKQSGFHNGGPNHALTSYTNHYNQKLNRCFVVFSNVETSRKGISVYKDVSDAFEGKDYAEFMWVNNKDKLYGEVKPFVCEVTILSGEEEHCKSVDDFDQLIKIYMDE